MKQFSSSTNIKRFIYENPEEAVNIIVEKNYAAIEDKELAVELIKSYGYPSATQHADNWDELVEDNVRYFANGLYDIGYLTTDPEEFTNSVYQKVDVSK